VLLRDAFRAATHARLLAHFAQAIDFMLLR
jgi:hypothetical protein